MFRSSFSDGLRISRRLLENRLSFWMALAKSGEADPWEALGQALLIDHHKHGLWCRVAR